MVTTAGIAWFVWIARLGQGLRSVRTDDVNVRLPLAGSGS